MQRWNAIAIRENVKEICFRDGSRDKEAKRCFRRDRKTSDFTFFEQ